MIEILLKIQNLLSLEPFNVCQKNQKDDTVMILDKYSYISAIEEILNDNYKFSKLDISAAKEINHIVNLEKRLTSELKLLKTRKLLINLLTKVKTSSF